MNTYEVEINIDGDEVRTYLVHAENDTEAAFTARDTFDDIVKVDARPVDDPDELDYDAVLEQPK